MGAAGKKLRGHGARHKSNSPTATAATGGYAPLPHPRRVLTGQRYTPLKARRRRPFTITRQLKNGRVYAVKLDEQRERITLETARLLAVDDAGEGLHYRFLGYQPARRYDTFAYLASLDPNTALLCLPDWHSQRLVRLPLVLLPDGTRRAGQWFRCTADLGQPTAGRLNIADLLACTDPGRRVCHQPDPPSPSDEQLPARPLLGRGCGDVVVELPDRSHLSALDGVIALHLGLHVDRTPNATRLNCDPQPVTIDATIPVDADRDTGRWRWRWWPRPLEQNGFSDALSEYRYDPEEHSDDYPWCHRSRIRPPHQPAGS
jgi:hypothetical protein